MSLDPPTYLSTLQNHIRVRPIPWDGAVRAGTISESQLSKIRAVDKMRKEQRRQTVEADLAAYRALFVGDDGVPSVTEAAAKRADVLQYVLVLVGDLMDGVPALVGALLDAPDPFRPFVPLLAHATDPEDPIPLLSSTVLTTLIAASSAAAPAVDRAMPVLLSYLSMLAKAPDSGKQDIAVLEFSSLLRGKKLREFFWRQRAETVEPLINILIAAAGVAPNGDSSSTMWSGAGTTRTVEGSFGGGVGLQLLYHVLLVLWQLSFESDTIGDVLEEEYQVVPLFTQLLRISPKEKTTRLLLSILYNLLSTNKKLLPAASVARLPALLQNLNCRHFSDQELLDDLKNLTDILEDYTKTHTTLDEYAAEVESGHLYWSPPHRNAVFWAENARRILEHENCALPKKLAEIMAKPWDNDKQVLAIACNDVGCLVKEVPEKRGLLEKLGLKNRVMELMASPDESVRWESLRAVGVWLRYSFETK